MTLEKVIESFRERVIVTESCWIWAGFVSSNGYGHYAVCLDDEPNKNYLAHRLSWIIHRGLIPRGMHVLHTCDVKLCVNPDHLYIGNQSDNTRDVWKRLRAGKPITIRLKRSRRSKVTKAEAGSLREAVKILQKHIEEG